MGGAAAAAGAGILKSALIGAGSAVALIATYSVVAPLVRTGRRASQPARPPSWPRAAPQAGSPAAPSAPTGARRAAPSVAATVSGSRPPIPGRPRRLARRRAPPRPSAGGLGPGAARAEPLASPRPVEATERETMLREESRLVGEARDALRRGDATGALAQLEQIQARFPGGVLGQEREALTIEALARSGRRAEASARATAFLQAYPTSVLAGRVQCLSWGRDLSRWAHGPNPPRCFPRGPSCRWGRPPNPRRGSSCSRPPAVDK